ncbi:MAG: hypothetical protein IT385_03570 [Deltaproteobacteria bacterium]|nr:hypothetical protein [Deltaproteobacteria bacterium]
MPRRAALSLALALAATSSALAAPPAPFPGRPAPEHRLVGGAAAATPVGLTARVRAHATFFGASSFPTDRDGTSFDLDPVIDTQFRVRADYRLALSPSARAAFLTLAYEHDLMSGRVAGGAGDYVGIDAPWSSDADDHQLRQAFARLSFSEALTLQLGATTSHWGLGLLANDGAHGWAPGSGRFSDPRGGDRVLRALVATGPHTELGLTAFAAIDDVLGDDVLVGDDEAWQAVAGVMLGLPTDAAQLGLYGVYRAQEARDGDRTEVGVVDLYGRVTHDAGRVTYGAELEAALITGSTDLAPTADHPTHDVLQVGAALRLTADMCMGGAALDVLFASGDAAFDDDTQSGFRADRNFDRGILLDDVVLAARSARTPIRAADPELVGVPSEDLDRLPTRGNPTNTLSFHPRGWLRPVDGLELYAGVLVALSASDESDAFNARVDSGGYPTNALGGDPGVLVATEIDLGARVSTLLWGTRLVIGLEGGVLLPGSGLTGPGDLGADPVWGGRALVTYEL